MSEENNRRLLAMEHRLAEISEQLRRIENHLNIVRGSCEGLDNHIEFIETVDSTLRAPLDFVTNNIVHPIMGREENHLPPSRTNEETQMLLTSE